MNFMDGKLEAAGSGLVFTDGLNLRVPLPDEFNAKLKDKVGPAMRLGIRPEHIHDPSSGSHLSLKATLKAKIEVVESLGHEKVIYFTKAAIASSAKSTATCRCRNRANGNLTLDANKVHIFDAATEKNLTARGGSV